MHWIKTSSTLTLSIEERELSYLIAERPLAHPTTRKLARELSLVREELFARRTSPTTPSGYVIRTTTK